MTRNRIFDMSEEAAASRIEKLILASLKGRPNSQYTQITDVFVKYDRRAHAYTQRIAYTIFNDRRHLEKVLQDCLIDRFALSENMKMTDHLADCNLSLVKYHADLILLSARQARRAFGVYLDNRKEVLIPILMRVLC